MVAREREVESEKGVVVEEEVVVVVEVEALEEGQEESEKEDEKVGEGGVCIDNKSVCGGGGATRDNNQDGIYFGWIYMSSERVVIVIGKQ